MTTFKKDWVEELACSKWCVAVESSLGIARQEKCLNEQRGLSMEYNVGDIINLRNDGGVFKIELKRKMETDRARRGSDDDCRFDGRMRIEVYHKDCGEYIITMTSREESGYTGRIIVCWLDTCNNKVEYYLGQIVQYEEKEDVFELMK